MSLRVCLVEGEMGRMEKKGGEKIVGKGVWLKGEGYFGGFRSFLSWPTKTQSLQIGEKMEDKIMQNFLDKNAHSSPRVYVFLKNK